MRQASGFPVSASIVLNSTVAHSPSKARAPRDTPTGANRFSQVITLSLVVLVLFFSPQRHRGHKGERSVVLFPFSVPSVSLWLNPHYARRQHWSRLGRSLTLNQ